MEAVNGVSEVDKGGPPAPSPLTGCYLLVVVGEPHSKEHKDIILRRIAKGLLSWDISDCHVDLEKELAIITEQAPDGEDARYGERLIQFASENLVTEILIHPAISTLSQCMKNLLSSFTRHRHIIHAGYTFAANGSWILQDGTFSLTDFSEAFQEMEVQRVLRAYDNSISLDIHCSPEGDWTRLPKESFSKNCKVRVNPDDVLTSGSPPIVNFLNYISPFLIPTDIEMLLESSDVVGNIRFSHPTLYVFPGGQGDAALFGINGFNMLVDGGFARKACFWDFVRHLDRLDAVLVTRLNNSNVNGISSVLRRKRFNTVYPQIGHFFCNVQERKAILSPDGDKDKDPLIVNLLEEGHEIVSNLKQLHLQPQACYRDIEPINLYHKVGHGTLDMYVLSPAKESKEVREFIQKWNTNDQRLFANQRNGRDFTFPTQNLVSICALLVWQPANANDSITRILFPGSTPQHKIFEGLDRLKQLECIRYPSCSAKTLTPSLLKSKQAKVEKIIQQEQKENKKEKLPESKAKMENRVAEENIKNIQTNGHVITEKIIKKHDSTESEKSGPQSGEAKKPEEGKEHTNLTNGKPAEEKVEKAKPKAKPEQKPKVEAKVYKHTRSIERKPKAPAEKKASPTTPKKTLDAKLNGDGPAKPKTLTKLSPSATPAKSAKEANNRKVVESKYKVAPKKDVSKPDKKEAKPERKPISRRPKESSPSGKVLESPVKKLNELHKVEARKTKLEKEGTTDSSTVSTPSADADTAMKKDISKLTPEELEQLKARELAELKEEQEVVKEIEAVFRKSEHKETTDSDLRKVKNISVDEKTEGEGEEYLIIEKEEIEHDSLDEKETKESETQKHLRDSEESEKQRKLSGEMTVEAAKDIKEEEPAEVPTLGESAKAQDDEAADVAKVKDEKEQHKEVSKEVSVASPDDKLDVSSGKKVTDRDIDEENKDANVLESQPDEKFSTPIESGATTAPTLPEDERIPLDEIKEDKADQIIEEKYVKEDTKEKEIPLVQLPPKTTEAVAKLPTVVGIRLDKQTPIRDLVKTPDEVADLPVHEEVDIENYEHYHVTQSHTPKQEELKQVTVTKEAKVEKAEKEPITKPEENASGEKEIDKKIDDTEKNTEGKQQEPTKVVEDKDKLVASDEAKELPVKVTEVEVLLATPHLKEELPEKEHEKEKLDLEKEKTEKTAEKNMGDENQEVEKVEVEEITIEAHKVAEKVEESKSKVEEVVTKADIQQKKEEEVSEKKETVKTEIEKSLEKDAAGKVEETTEADPSHAKTEKKSMRVDTEQEEIDKETEKEDVKKVETIKDVAKTEVEKVTEVDLEKTEVEKPIAKADIDKNELQQVIEKEDIEKTAAEEKIDDKIDEDVKAGETDVEKAEVETAEVEKPEVPKLTPEIKIDEEVIEKVIEKEEAGVKEPVEKTDTTKAEVDKLTDEICVTKTEIEKTTSKVDAEEKKQEEQIAEKADLETVEKPEVIKQEEVSAKEEHLEEQVDTEKIKEKDAKEETKVHQEKEVTDTVKEVKPEPATKMETKTHRDEQNDDVEAKIVAIEKELVAVITEDVKEIEKLEEKADKPEKEQKVEEIEKVDVENENLAAENVKLIKVDDVKETKQEKPDSGEIKEIQAAEAVHSKVMEEKPASKTGEKEIEPHDKEAKEDVKEAVEQLEEKTEDTLAKQPEKVDQEKIKEVKDLKVTTEIKSDAVEKDLKDVEDIDKKIVEPEKPALKLEDEIVLEKICDVVIPDVKHIEKAEEKIENISAEVSEVKEEPTVAVKEEVKEEVKADQHQDAIKEHKLEDLGIIDHVEKAPTEDDKTKASSKIDVEKADDGLKNTVKEIVEEVAKSDTDKGSETEQGVTDQTEIIKDTVKSDDIKPCDKNALEVKLEKGEDKVAEKVEVQQLLTDKTATEETEKTKDRKDTDSKEIEEITKEKIHHEVVETEIQDVVGHTDDAKTEVKSEITVKDSGHDLKGLDTLDSQILETNEIKEISEKKETLAEEKLISKESGEKHSEKGIEDVKDVEKVDKHDIKKEIADVKLDDEKSDKEKSAIEQKEEDTGKSDKTFEPITAQAKHDDKIDQKGKTAKEAKEEKPQIEDVGVREDEKIIKKEKDSIPEESEDKKEDILPQTAQDADKHKKEFEIEKSAEKEKATLAESIEKSCTIKHDILEDSTTYEKKDEGKEEKLFKVEQELVRDIKTLPSDKPLPAKVDEVIKETADDIVKEVVKDLKKMDNLPKTDEKETSEKIKSEDEEKDIISKVEKVMEKVEEISTIQIQETEAKVEEDVATDKKITSLAAAPEIIETEIEMDLTKSVKKIDTSVKAQEHETDFKVSKSDVTKLSQGDKSSLVEYAEKQVEPEQVSVSVEKLDKTPSLEPSKTDEKTVQQGEKDYVGETGEKTAIKSFHEDSIEISKIDQKLQDLKETADPEDKIQTTDDDLEHSSKSQIKNEIDVVDKLELGRKSPKEREQDVAKIVASVAEVLKSDAPLEEFEGKIPLEITTFGPYELRETHITTVESPIREDVIADTIQMRPLEDEKSAPKDHISMFLDEERKVAPVHTDYDNLPKDESRVSSLLKDSHELIQATSKIISDIKQSSKVDDDVVSEDIKETDLLSEAKKVLEMAPETARDLALESKEPALKKTSTVLDESSPKTVDVKEESLDSTKKKTLDTKECDINVDSLLIARKSTPDIREQIQDALEVDKLQTSSGKSSPEVKEPSKEAVDVDKSLISSGKTSPDRKESIKGILTADKSPITSGKTTPDLKDDITDILTFASGKTTPDIKPEEVPISGKSTPEVLEPMKKTDTDASKSTILSGKSSPDIKETTIDLVPSGKTSPEIKQKVDVDKDLFTSEKTTPEIKEPATDLIKSIVDPEKIASDIKETVKSSSEATPVTSEKTTPEIKEPVADVSKYITDSEKVASDIKETVKTVLEETPKTSEKTTEIKELVPDLSTSKVESKKVTSEVKDTAKGSLEATPITSGKTTPEIIEPICDLSKSIIDSETVTLNDKESSKSPLDTTPITSGKTTPEIKEPTTDLSKTIIDSAKATSDLKESIKSSTPITSAKTTPEIKEIVAELPKPLVGSENITSDIKESTKSPLDTPPVASGKTTPEIKEPAVVSSGKSSPDFVDKATIASAKATPDEVVKDVLATSTSSIISEKSTAEMLEPIKDTLDTSKSPILSGKSTPDIVIDEDKSSVASGRSTPDIEEPVDKHLTDLEKRSTDKTVVTSQKPSDAEQSTTQIETDKKIAEPEVHSSEVKVTHVGSVQTEIPPQDSKESAIQGDLSVTTTAVPTDASKASETTRKLSSDISKSQVTSGKSTPDSQHSTKNGTDQLKSPVDSRKSSLKEPIEIDRASSASGKSTPELKDPVSVISGRTTPDTKLPVENDSVKPELSTVEDKSTAVISDTKVAEVKDQQTISEHATKIESIAGPSSSSKDGRASPSPTEELEYSRKSTPDIADITKSKDLDESFLGRTTPPTVPVSPIVKEKHLEIHEQEKGDKKDVPEVFIIKTTEARSSTPASDDCDISSGQVSRVLTTEEDDEKQVYSDDEDLPGSPLSATSQVAHSTSSQYDFEDSVRGVGPIDPMSTSFYGALPDDPVDLSKRAKTSRFLDEADLDFEKALHEHRQTRGEDLTSGASPSHVYEITTAKYSSIKLQEETQTQKPVASAPVTIPKESIMTSSFIGSELPTEPKVDPIASWGKPLGLPSPAPLNDNKGTPKKERRIPPNVMAKNKLNEDKKLSDSKYDRRGKKINPVYVDLTYVPHHGNSNYSYVDFFKRVRARYYVFSGIEPSKEVYNALLEAKQTWDDKELEVTIIPTYDTDVLGYWVAENEDLLAKCKIDLSPSASRCTINLQDHETSCSAYRLEFS